MSKVVYKVAVLGNRQIWRKDDGTERGGEQHREDGPAYEDDDRNEWWIDNQLHREEGPAIEYTDGKKKYYVRGKELTEEEFEKLADKEFKNK